MRSIIANHIQENITNEAFIDTLDIVTLHYQENNNYDEDELLLIDQRHEYDLGNDEEFEIQV